ncbi:MAG: FAD-linked oxidase C-terminal domain-containing protein [Alphaproteobacteria bacterium]|nr:FAD-linked oxidase C-terminal domain-containing protein [Alphaproteobacteria bacterium]
MALDHINMTVDALRGLLGDRLSTGQSVLDIHSHDEAYASAHVPDAVAFPQNADEVSAIVTICAQHQCPIIPYGVGTSLEGHIVPAAGGITIDTSQMNAVISINPDDMDAVVESGVTRTQLNEELKSAGLMFTVDPGADATMGGMAATRASGTNTVRYGTIRENVLSMDVVLPSGEQITVGSRARKSASGYDLKNLFIGSEGTLGIITKLTVKLHGIPEAISAASCVFEDIDDAVQAVITAIQSGIPMARIELLDDMQMRGMNIYNPGFNAPEKPHLFLEFHGSQTSIEEQIDMFRMISADHGGSDFLWAKTTEDRNRLWAARHSAYYAGRALRPGASSLVTDCCVPLSALAPSIAAARELVVESGLMAPMVGHVGDGNFHLLILVDPDNADEWQRAKTLSSKLNHLAISFGGTITGEHGVGSGKREYMRAEHGGAYDVMQQIKSTIDPLNIMNPGKIFMPTE